MWTVRASLVNVVSLVGIVLMVLCPGAPAAPAAPPQDALHQVMPGDDLRLIAGYYYGDTRQWERIWQANREQISNPNRIERGALLRIPDAVVPAEPYADFVARARVLAPPPTAPAAAETREAPAAGAPPSEAAPTLAAPMPSIPQGEPLPPPSGPVTLRLKPAKGFAQVMRATAIGRTIAEAEGQAVPIDVRARYRLHMTVDDVGPDGMVRLALSLSDPETGGTAPFSFAAAGLPELGETLRLTASPLNRIVRVEGKEPGSPHYFSPLFPLRYPEAPVSVGRGWQYEETQRAPDGTEATFAVKCSLGRRERSRNEEAYRIQCAGKGTGSNVSVPDMRLSVNETSTIVVRAHDGTLMFWESVKQLSTEVPSRKMKISGETHGILQLEGISGPGSAAPLAPSKEPAKRP